MDTLILPILTLGPVSDKMLNQMMTLYISQYRNLPGVAGMAYCTGVHPRRLAAKFKFDHVGCKKVRSTNMIAHGRALAADQ
jgi:hypothetical protein